MGTPWKGQGIANRLLAVRTRGVSVPVVVVAAPSPYRPIRPCGTTGPHDA